LIKDNDDDDDGGGGGGGGGDETNIIIKKVQVKHKRTMKREYEYTKCREYKKTQKHRPTSYHSRVRSVTFIKETPHSGRFVIFYI